MLEGDLAELHAISQDARAMSEGGNNYIFLPGLKLSQESGTVEVDALLCLTARDGYLTRLFLSQTVPGKGNNWTTHRILDRTWHTWSWNGVSSTLRPAQILLGHLRALR